MHLKYNQLYEEDPIEEQSAEYNATQWSPNPYGAFIEGWKNKNRLSYRKWQDTLLTPKQWLAKYPDKTINDYKIWRRQLPSSFNWLQKLILPQSIRRNLRGIR